MPSNDFIFHIKGVDELSKAFDSAKQSAKKGSTDLAKMSGGGYLVGGESGGSPVSLKGAPASLTKSQKIVEKSLLSMVKLLTEIRNHTKGIGGKIEGVGEVGTGQSGNKSPETGKGNFKSMGGILKLLGIGGLVTGAIGGVLAAGGWALSQGQRVQNSFKSAAASQLGTAQTLGTMGLAPQLGVTGPFAEIKNPSRGYFAGYESLGISGNKHAEFARIYGEQVYGEDFIRRQGREILKGPVGQESIISKERKELDKEFKTNAYLSAATGIDLSDLARLSGRTRRFTSTEDITGRKAMVYLKGKAEQVGMGGGRTKEFFAGFEDVFENAISKGMNLSNEKLIDHLSLISSGGSPRVQMLAPEITKGQQNIYSAGANLQGGAGSALALSATMEYMKTKSPGGNILLKSRKLMQNNPALVSNLVANRISKMTPGMEELTASNLGIVPGMENIEDKEKYFEGMKKVTIKSLEDNPREAQHTIDRATTMKEGATTVGNVVAGVQDLTQIMGAADFAANQRQLLGMSETIAGMMGDFSIDISKIAVAFEGLLSGKNTIKIKTE